MISWRNKANAHFSQKRAEGADETNTSPVLSVPPAPFREKHAANDCYESELLNDAGWRVLRDDYYNHHASCPTCRAAGLGYGLRCGAGAALWAEYGRDLPPPLRPRKGARG